VRFYLTVDCEVCGEAVYYGPVLVLDEHRGLPTIPVDVVEHTRFECGRCGRETVTGELPVFSFTVPDEPIEEGDV